MNLMQKFSLRYARKSLLKAGFGMACVFAFSSTVAVLAQSVSSAKMHGTVADNTGAVISGATVVATQVESGATATAVSGDNGSYALPNLPVGPYSIKVTAKGFQAFSRTGVVLQVSNDAEVDIPLAVGSAETVITVDATAAQVQTDDTSISTVVDQARVVDLPLNGRNAANLVLLSGASAPTVNGNMTSTKSYGSTGTSAIGGALNIAVAGGQGN